MTFGFWGSSFSRSSGGNSSGGYDRNGYDCNGYDRSGYDKSGRDCNGYDKSGYDRSGRDCDGYDKSGYDKNGRDCDGYDKSGYDKSGRDCDGYDKSGYDKNGRDCDGKSRDDDDRDHGGKDRDHGGKDRDHGGKDDDSCDDDRDHGGKDDDDHHGGGKGDDSCDDDRDHGGKDDDDHHGGGKDDDSCGDDTPPPPPVDDCDDDTPPPPPPVDDIPCKTATFVIDGEIDTQITLTEMDDGTIRVDVKELDGAIVGDLRGVFFDINDESKLAGMTVSGADVGASDFDANSVTNVATGVNIKGEVLNQFGAFDGGVEIGTNGLSRDDVRETSFVLSSTSGPLTLEDFTGADFALRYTSVGTEGGGGCGGGSRGDSLKIGGNAGDLGAHCTTASLGDRVWIDANKDGIQNDGELGLGGVTVELLKDGVLTGASVVTADDGSYLFEGLAAGDYSIKVTESSGLYAFAGRNAVGSTEANDSDVNASGLSDTFTLAEGQDLRDVDAGLVVLAPVVQLGSLGDTIWLDANANGVQDDGEAGVSGVTVELIAGGVATGQTVTTGADGKYLFTDLEAGDYAVQVTGVAAGYEFTSQNVAGTEATDSDVNASGLSDTYTLAEGENYFDLDAGIKVALPTVGNDMGGTCAHEIAVLDVLANDDSGLTINAVNGTAISEGGSVTLASGAIVTLTAGALVYDGIAAWAGLSFMQEASDMFTYTATTAQGGEATATVDMMIAGNPAVDLAEIALSLTGTVDFTITEISGQDYPFDLTTVSADNLRLNVTDYTAVYCVDFAGQVVSDVTLTADIYISDPNNAALSEFVVNVQNLDLINYVLNQDYSGLGYTGQDIQDAIWFLSDNYNSLSNPHAYDILVDAFGNGEGFVAGSGDLVGLILAPIQEVDVNGNAITDYQNFIYGVEYDVLADCLM